MTNSDFQNEKVIPLTRLIYKNILLIIMIVVLTSLIGLGYAVAKVRPTYTANRSFILRVSESGANVNNEAALGKLFISNIKDLLVLPEYVDEANKIYKQKQNGQTDIKAGAISVNYNDESLIFTLSYTDSNGHDAAAKVHAIYLVASEKLAEDMNVGSVKLIDIDNVNINVEKNIYEGLSYSFDGGYVKWVIIGAFIGVVISMCIVLVMYLLDNTIRNKEELEQITNSSVLAYIAKNKK